MKTITIDGDVWFVDKIVAVIYFKEDREIHIRTVHQEDFVYEDRDEEDFEGIKFELANLTKN